jgi:hypothetical protein
VAPLSGPGIITELQQQHRPALSTLKWCLSPFIVINTKRDFSEEGGPPLLACGHIHSPPEIRQQLERNTGVFVWIVMNDSPAFNANVLEGDVILKFNGEDVTSASDFVEKCAKLAGQKVEVEIWRNGQFKTISVQFNNKALLQ